MTFSSSQATSFTEYDIAPFTHVNDDICANADEKEITALRQQASRLEHLLQVMPAGVIVIDGMGFVRQANKQARDLLGEPLEGQLWRTIIKRSFKPRADDGHEVSLHDGRRVKLSITPLDKEPGQLIVMTDLTETRQLQARLSHMQRLSSLGKMVASLAHQIRTPLAAAMLYAANLGRKGLAQDSAQQFAGKLQDRLKELESQVNDMLLFAKSGEEQVVNPISVDELVQAIEATSITMTQPLEQNVHFEGVDTKATVQGNITALQGALLNLIHNGSQISPKATDIDVQFQRHHNWLVISITDSGPGVSTELKDKIFEPFFTTKTHGTGLGLAVVKSVVNAHQGTIRVDNIDGRGARFTLALPCLPQSENLSDHSAI